VLHAATVAGWWKTGRAPTCWRTVFMPASS
jgi:hypothetical protein